MVVGGCWPSMEIAVAVGGCWPSMETASGGWVLAKHGNRHGSGCLLARHGDNRGGGWLLAKHGRSHGNGWLLISNGCSRTSIGSNDRIVLVPPFRQVAILGGWWTAMETVALLGGCCSTQHICYSYDCLLVSNEDCSVDRCCHGHEHGRLLVSYRGISSSDW